MILSGVMAKELADELRARCRLLREQVRDRELGMLMNGVIHEAQAALRGVEARLEEAGSMPGDVASALMTYGAITAVLEDLPEAEDRHQLVEAGRAIGRFLAKRYAEKITEQLQKPKERSDA